MEKVQVLDIILRKSDVITQFTQWCLWGRSSTVTAGVLARFKMHVAILQQAGQVAEVTNWTQTLQLLGHVALLPATVTSSHLDRRGGEGGKKRKEKEDGERHRKINTQPTVNIQWGTLFASLAHKVQFSGTSMSLPRSTVQCTGTCSGVCRTPPSCLRSGCAASSDWCRSSRCRDARDDLCYEMSAHAWRVAYSLEHRMGGVSYY